MLGFAYLMLTSARETLISLPSTVVQVGRYDHVYDPKQASKNEDNEYDSTRYTHLRWTVHDINITGQITVTFQMSVIAFRFSSYMTNSTH
jgi:hypothetical protein